MERRQVKLTIDKVVQAVVPAGTVVTITQDHAGGMEFCVPVEGFGTVFKHQIEETDKTSCPCGRGHQIGQ